MRDAYPKNHFIYYTNSSISVNDQRIEVRSSTYPDHNIIDFSHSCIPIAPDNPFLGYQGKFVDYVHYENLELPQELQYKVGAITPESLMKYRMQPVCRALLSKLPMMAWSTIRTLQAGD